MTTIETRHSLGDVVFGVHLWQVGERRDCDLCARSGYVEIVKPQGYAANDWSVMCPRCTGKGYRYTNRKQLNARIQRLTVGQVRVKVEQHETTVDYMAHETGIGSGSVWDEGKLYATEGEAEQAVAEAGAVRQLDELAVARSSAGSRGLA